MKDENSRLFQYAILSDHRLHFGRLYFQVIGLNLSLVVVAGTAIAIGLPAWWTAARLIAGGVLAGTGFVASRLHHQEELYASALRRIELAESRMVAIPASKRLGARQIVAISCVVIGIMLATEAAIRLLRP